MKSSSGVKPPGPPRGGPGGPCDHCARTYSPCWRKGPPEKPLLCNACGAHYLVKKSLDGYKPGQKSSNRSTKPAAPRRSKKEKDPKLENLVTGSEVAVPQPRSRSKPDSGSPTKRKRAANKRYTDQAQGGDDGAEFKRPRSLNLKHIRREDSEVAIADTPMAVNLLADMADRRKKHAPPPVWELTSPRGIEGAKQRTFNALMASRGPARRTPSIPRRQSEDDSHANPAHVTPDIADGEPGEGVGALYSADVLVDAHSTGAELMEDYPYAKRTVLHAYDSPITMVEMSDIINTRSLSAAVAKSSDAEVAALASMLPECDRDASCLGGINDGTFTNPVFVSAVENLQGLQTAGMFDREAPGVSPPVVDYYRRLRTEADLSGWKNEPPLTGKRRRAALQQKDAEHRDVEMEQSLPPGELMQPADGPVAPSATVWIDTDLPEKLSADHASQQMDFAHQRSTFVPPT